MKPKLEWKSVFAGLGLGLLMTGVLGAGATLRPAPQTLHRYEMHTLEGHAFVLDTVTGQVWESFEPPSGGSTDEGFGPAKLNVPPAK